MEFGGFPRYDGSMRHSCIATLLVVSLIGSVAFPPFAHAAVDREALLAQLADITARIAVLERQLEAMTAAPTPFATTAATERFDAPAADATESRTYRVRSARLVTPSEKQIPPADADLFALFTDVLGPERVDEHFKEFSVFSDAKSDLGGYVERAADEALWLAAVNRAAYLEQGAAALDGYATLYLHEYAHVLADEHRDRLADFRDRFWRPVDLRHAQRVTDLAAGEERFMALLSHYEKHADRFVSDYATLSPEEDFAETFAEFVLEERPRTARSGSAATKLRFFYEYPDWQLLRNELRANVASLGLR